MNIKAEINEIEYRKVAEKVNETESWPFFFLKRSLILTNLQKD